jgi:hypothetical protein
MARYKIGQDVITTSDCELYHNRVGTIIDIEGYAVETGNVLYHVIIPQFNGFFYFEECNLSSAYAEDSSVVDWLNGK